MAVVSGRLQMRDWTDRDGRKMTSAEIVADNVYFGEAKRREETPPAYTPAYAPADPPPGQSRFRELNGCDESELPWNQ